LILLDTHVLIWAVEDHSDLGRQAVQAIERAESAGGAYVSAITTWEVSMLAAKRKLSFRPDVGTWVKKVLAKPGLHLAPISPAIGVDAGQLPGDLHGDPADRLIVATARILNFPLLTADRQILAYGATGTVDVIDARL